MGLAILLHRHAGPGLLESFYGAALCRAPERADILVDGTAILEITAVPAPLPAHDMRLQTYYQVILTLTLTLRPG